MSSEWKHISTKAGISTYKRDVPGSAFREFRGETYFDTRLSSLVALTLDADNMASWMHKTEEVRLLESIDDQERIAYMAFDFTPLPKRDLVVRNKVSQCPETLRVTYSMEYIPQHPVLAESRRGHMQGITGFVTAEPTEDGRVKVVYQAHVEPGVSLLKMWGASHVTNQLLADTPYYTLKNASRLVNTKYKDASFSFIQEA